jgi:hypothetical protein
MKVGDLVKITRSSIGLPAGSLGVITEHTKPLGIGGRSMCRVEIVSKTRRLTGRYYEGDLEVVSEAR